MIMASAVMSTVETRVTPASMLASRALPCSASRSLANDTTRILFAVATPMHMIAPINAGTLRVSMSEKEQNDNAGERSGQSRDDDEGVSQD